MTTWTNKSSIKTHFTNVDNSTIYGTRTNFNQSGVSFNQLGVKFNNWFTSYENRNVIYTDVENPNYLWNSAYNFEQIGYLLLEDGGLLLLQSGGYIEILSGQETQPISDEWTDVRRINTTWI